MGQRICAVWNSCEKGKCRNGAASTTFNVYEWLSLIKFIFHGLHQPIFNINLHISFELWYITGKLHK